jgi:hypothetical protein
MEQRVKPEFIRFACFYFDQLCTYLQKTIAGAQNEPAHTTSDSANFSTNEEKIKEMWGKLLYSLCRCPTPKMIKLLNSLFSVLTAFQFLNKPFYEQFMLKKLEFEPLFTELQDRLKPIYQSVLIEKCRGMKGRDRLLSLREELTQVLSSEVCENGNGSVSEIIRTLTKVQVHLIRMFSCEFLFHHIILNVHNL